MVEYYLICLVYSAILLTCIWWGLARAKLGAHFILLLALGSTFVSVCLFSSLLFLQSVGILVGTVPLLLFTKRPRNYLVMAAMVMIAVYAMHLPSSLAGLEKLRDLQAAYPEQSISPRLNYEAHSNHSAADTIKVSLSPEVSDRLSDAEQKEAVHHGSRAYFLRQLHDSKEEAFIVGDGFGFARMGRVSEDRVQLPPARSVALSCLNDLQKDLPQSPRESAAADTSRPDNAGLFAMHDSGRSNFLDPELFGYVKDRDHVAGFESHRFSRLPTSDVKSPALQSWKIAKLELVSLLKHETPVAYVSDSLPNLEELDKFPTRPLDEFEAAALPKLVAEEDLVIDEQPDRIRMLGSLRASKNCQQCHSVTRGVLLGAFTYDLQRVESSETPRAAIPH